MNNRSNKNHAVDVASAIGLSISLSFSILASSQGAIAETMSSLVTSPLLAQLGFVPPADDGAPAYTRGGATRNPACDALQVLPKNGSGLTLSSKPMVQAYFQSGVKQVWMIVEAEDGSEYYTYQENEYFALPAGKGFAEVPLPDSVGELTYDKQYRWSMILLCDQPMGPSSPVIHGGIRRVSGTASPVQLASMSLLEKAQLYGELGLWYDFISALTQMRLEMPNNTQIALGWETSLRAVDLDVIFDEFETVE